jgi:branched-chain amino acid transport system ATP-binding protein
MHSSHQPDASGLNVRDLVVHRGGHAVLHGVSIAVAPGEITALLGANGAGKSSLIMTIAGAVPSTSGQIAADGISLVGLSPDIVRRKAVAAVPEGHRVLGALTVHDNLRAAGSMLNGRALAGEIDARRPEADGGDQPGANQPPALSPDR